MNTNQNPLPIALFLGITGGIIVACAIFAYQLITGMSQAAKDTAGILLVAGPLLLLLVVGIIWVMRKPQPRHTRPAEPSETGQDWAAGNSADPYHIQHPHPSAAKGLPAPQYDETLIYTPPQANKARNWAIVDEVKQ